jgi:peptidoglycan/xylan/chitin deacetylase (PgdA/CDA1 family)
MLIAYASGIALILAVYISPQGWRVLQTHRLRRRCSFSRSLVLTYDDGPGRHLTPALLDLLDSHGAKATFFPLGFRASLNPQIVDRVAAAGHEIGCHGQKHLNAWRHSAGTVIADIDAGYLSLSPWVGPNGVFRPPWGKLTLPTVMWLRRRKAPLGWWTINSQDVGPEPRDGQMIIDAVCRTRGGVVLMHDFDRSGEGGPYVVKLTESLLKCARLEGLRVCRLCDLTG